MKFKSTTETLPQIMIIPMIDIMFFLLVFFMLSTLNMSSMHAVPLKLVASQDTKVIGAKGLIISVDMKGEIFVGENRIAKAELGQYVQSALHKNPNDLIILRVDKDNSYTLVHEVMEKLKDAGVRRISLASETRT